MARGELHVQLNVDYADDEKLADVSRSARLLYVDALCKAKRMLNDGVLTQAQVEKLMYPESKAAAKKAVEELVATGAWQRDDERKVYLITAWLKRNKSRAQIESDRKAAEDAALLGNHKRWHVARGETDPKCRHCAEGEGPDPGSGSRSGTRSGPVAQPESGGNRVLSPETETETETKNKNQPPVAPRAVETHAPEPDGNPGRAEQLVQAWMTACTSRPPSRVVDDVGREVAQMLRDGINPADIRRGLELWQSRGSNAKTLPSYVNQVMNARPTNVVALPDRRPSTTDQRVGAALELAAKYAQEDLA